MPTTMPAWGELSISRAFTFCLLLLAGLVPAAAHGQITYTGTTANQNFGSVAIGSTSSAKSFSFSVAAGTTVGSIGVLTQGAPNLDFSSASGGTCAVTTYSSATTCNVNATFKPAFAGARMGAIVFFSGSGNTGTVLGSVAIYGSGSGAQIAFAPAVTGYTTPYNGASPDGLFDLAEDGSGNLYMAEAYSSGQTEKYTVAEVHAQGSSGFTFINPTVEGNPLNLPKGVAIDGAGNLYIADSGNERVVEVPVGGGAATAIAPVVDGLSVGAELVRVDGAGDLFISDAVNERVVEIPAGGGAPIAIDPTVNGVSLGEFSLIAVDAAGDLVIDDRQNERFVEVPAGGGAAFVVNTTVSGQIGGTYSAAAFDPNGNLFLVTQNSGLVEVPAVGSPRIVIGEITAGYSDQGTHAVSPINGLVIDGQGNFYLPGGVTIDERGDVLESVVQIVRPTSASATFTAVTAVGSTDTKDGTETVQIQNIGNAAVTGSIIYPADFPEASGDSKVCTSAAALTVGGPVCDLSIEFKPEQGGALNEKVTVGSAASIPVSGTALASAQLISPAPGTVLTSSTQTFTWSATAGSLMYQLLIGTTPGGYNIFSGTIGSNAGTSLTASGLPLNGETLYVKLEAENGSVIAASSYTFATGTQGMLMSPSPNSTLAGPSIMFTWSAGTGATGYALWLGTTLGGHDILQGGIHTATSLATSNLPTNGETIYARLWTSYNGVLEYNDHQYTAAQQAVMVSPSPGSIIASNVTFNWNGASPAATYALWLGTTGLGSSNLMQGGFHSATSATFNALPSTGVTIYARLWTSFNQAQVYTDYTFTATQATMISPAGGSTLVGPSVIFSWTTGGSTPTGYALWLGTTGVGSHDLLATGVHPVTSYTYSGFPTNGATIYARLWTSVGGTLTYGDYQYNAVQKSVITFPAPDSTLPITPTGVSFQWSTVDTSNGYALWLGTTGVGSHDLWESGFHPATSSQLFYFPANGATIYARIWTNFAGVLVYNDYTYTEAAGPRAMDARK